MRPLLAMGVLGGAWLLVYAFLPGQCAPVTAESEVFCSRLWTPALFGITAGFIGLRRWVAMLARPNAVRGLSIVAAGAALMTFGNFAEYWLFSAWPHDGPDGWLRGMLWMSFLLGWLAVLVGSVVAGVVLLGRRNQVRVRILGSLLITIVSFTVFVGLLAVSVLAAASSLYGLLALRRAAPNPIAEAA